MDHDFFTAYTTYTSDNYAPDVYHTWCAFGTLASVLSRKVWLDIGHFRFFPNLYVCLDGEAGWGKNTALDRAMDIVKAIGTTTISASRQSKEDFICDLARCKIEYTDHFGQAKVQTPYVVYATELAQWLSIDPIGMADVWTAIYDEKYDYSCGTIKHGRQTVRGPYLNLLVGVQPDKLAKYMSFEALSTGFLRRCNFIWPTVFRPKRLLFDTSPAGIEALETCINIARNLSALTGPFTFTPEALDWYRNWFETRRSSNNPLIRQYDENLHVQLIKLAMLTSVGYSLSRVIQLEHLITSLAHLDLVKTTLPTVLSGIGRNDLAKVSDMLLTLLREAPGHTVTEKDLRVALWHQANDEEFIAIVHHLQTVGKIKSATAISPSGVSKSAWTLIT